MRAKPRSPKIWHPEAGPILWFLVDQPRGTHPGDTGDVADLTGNMAAAVRTGAVYNRQLPGWAILFNGSNQYATTPANFALSGNPTFTVAFTCYIATSSACLLLGFGDANSGSAKAFGVGWNLRGTTHVLSAEFAGGTPAYVDTPVAPFVPHRVVVTKTPGAINSTTNIYVDGAYQGANNAGSSSSTPNISSGFPFVLGRFANDNSDSPMTGWLENVQVYPYAWGQGDVHKDIADPYWRLRPPRRASGKKPPIVGNASALVIITATTAVNRITSSSASAIVVITATAREGHEVPVSASAEVIITARARSTATAAAEVIVAALASAVRVAHVNSASASVVIAASASASGGHQVALLSGQALLRITARARIPGRVVVETQDYLGRFQQGTEVPIEVQCYTTSGATVLPDSAPVARMYRDGALVGVQVLPESEDATGRFGGSFLLDQRAIPGRYAVVSGYVVAGLHRLQLLAFEVVASGDPEGEILALHSVVRPEADAVLAHSGEGTLLLGSGPYLSEGL